MKKRVLAINIVFTLIGIEIATRIFLREMSTENIGIEQCAKWHGYAVHPYLAYHSANCIGEEEIPFKTLEDLKKDGKRVVGIFGGSVAAGLASSGILEETLNRETGKIDSQEYRTVNFSFGGWRHPNQSIALLLYGDYVDIAIAVEGFNEHYFLRNESDVDMTLAPSSYHKSRDSGLRESVYYWFNRNIFEARPIGQLGLARMIKIVMRDGLKRKHDRKGYFYNESVKKEFGKVDWKHNMARYRGFIQSFKAIGKAKDIKTLVVLQPTPLERDIVDETELAAVGDLDYLDAYERVREVVIRMEGGLDLSRMFDKSKEKIFGDHIHFVGHMTKASVGDRALSQRIVNELKRRGYI